MMRGKYCRLATTGTKCDYKNKNELARSPKFSGPAWFSR
jgi:hypothetical protein